MTTLILIIAAVIVCSTVVACLFVRGCTGGHRGQPHQADAEEGP